MLTVGSNVIGVGCYSCANVGNEFAVAVDVVAIDGEQTAYVADVVEHEPVLVRADCMDGEVLCALRQRSGKLSPLSLNRVGVYLLEVGYLRTAGAVENLEGLRSLCVDKGTAPETDVLCASVELRRDEPVVLRNGLEGLHAQRLCADEVLVAGVRSHGIPSTLSIVEVDIGSRRVEHLEGERLVNVAVAHIVRGMGIAAIAVIGLPIADTVDDERIVILEAVDNDIVEILRSSPLERYVATRSRCREVVDDRIVRTLHRDCHAVGVVLIVPDLLPLRRGRCPSPPQP